MDPVRDNFIKSLSNYSECIKPYLRQIQDKYIVAQYIVEKDKVEKHNATVATAERAKAALVEAEKQLEAEKQKEAAAATGAEAGAPSPASPSKLIDKAEKAVDAKRKKAEETAEVVEVAPAESEASPS